MSDDNIQAIITPDMIEVNDELREVIANICNENIKDVIEYNFNDPFYMFDDEDKPDQFYVYFNESFEIKKFLSLDELIDATITCNDSKKLFNAVADNLERLAKKLRDA